MDFSVGRGIMKVWGVSSFGRALPWHGRGEEFEPPTLHQTRRCLGESARSSNRASYTPPFIAKIANLGVFSWFRSSHLLTKFNKPKSNYAYDYCNNFFYNVGLGDFFFFSFRKYFYNQKPHQHYYKWLYALADKKY